MQSLLDLATLLEAKGASATYVGAGTFAEAQARVPAEIVNLLTGSTRMTTRVAPR